MNALLQNKKREVVAPSGVVKYFKAWKMKLEKIDPSISPDLISFIAGYTLGNNTILREKYIQELKNTDITTVFDDNPFYPRS